MIGCKLLPLRSESMAVSQYLKDMIMGGRAGNSDI